MFVVAADVVFVVAVVAVVVVDVAVAVVAVAAGSHRCNRINYGQQQRATTPNDILGALRLPPPALAPPTFLTFA